MPHRGVPEGDGWRCRVCRHYSPVAWAADGSGCPHGVDIQEDLHKERKSFISADVQERALRELRRGGNGGC